MKLSPGLGLFRDAICGHSCAGPVVLEIVGVGLLEC